MPGDLAQGHTAGEELANFSGLFLLPRPAFLIPGPLDLALHLAVCFVCGKEGPSGSGRSSSHSSELQSWTVGLDSGALRYRSPVLFGGGMPQRADTSVFCHHSTAAEQTTLALSGLNQSPCIGS